MEVKRITYKQAMVWCLEKHYAKRKPMFQHAFGLVENGLIQGVVVYGRPPVQIEKNVINGELDFNYTVFELTRLVVQTKTKNACSFLIANSLKMLPRPSIVVSYADSAMNHSGIVYQSTNWLYTGGNKAHDCEYIVDGKKMHPKTITERLGVTAVAKWAKENNIERIKPKIKHRYFYINASKLQRRKIIKNMRYKVINEYPKCEKKLYDAGVDIIQELEVNQIEQLKLF